MITTPLGKHFLVELYHCGSDIINDIVALESIMRRVAKLCNTTIIDTKFHHFSPQGISGVILIAESHLTVHTWPEHGYIAFDFFTCNISLDLMTELDTIKTLFKAARVQATVVNRGLFSNINEDSPQ